MIEMTFYINTDIALALELTGLAADELEQVVGRFTIRSTRAGLLKGKLVQYANGKVQIRKCFGNKLLWSNE